MKNGGTLRDHNIKKKMHYLLLSCNCIVLHVIFLMLNSLLTKVKTKKNVFVAQIEFIEFANKTTHTLLRSFYQRLRWYIVDFGTMVGYEMWQSEIFWRNLCMFSLWRIWCHLPLPIQNLYTNTKIIQQLKLFFDSFHIYIVLLFLWRTRKRKNWK